MKILKSEFCSTALLGKKLFLSLLLWYMFWLESVQFQVFERGIKRCKNSQITVSLLVITTWLAPVLDTCSNLAKPPWASSKKRVKCLGARFALIIFAHYTHAFIRWAFSYRTGRFDRSSLPWTLWPFVLSSDSCDYSGTAALWESSDWGESKRLCHIKTSEIHVKYLKDLWLLCHCIEFFFLGTNKICH